MHFLQLIFSRYMLKGSTMVLYYINICRGWRRLFEPEAEGSKWSRKTLLILMQFEITIVDRFSCKTHHSDGNCLTTAPKTHINL